MTEKITWQPQSEEANSAENFATISQWWEGCADRTMTWAQRLIPESGNSEDINWEQQQFDETFLLNNPQVRGITLYWYKDNAQQERNITPRKLEFEPQRQQLYVYPSSQPQLVIRIGNPKALFRKIELRNPQTVGDMVGENYVFVMRDREQQLDVKVILSSSQLERFKANLP